MTHSNRLFRLTFVIVQMFCATIALFMTIWTIWAIGPAVERHFLPVVELLRIVSAVEIEPGHVEIYAQFRKVRDCRYLSISWYVGQPTKDFRQVRVQTITDDAALSDHYNPSRPLGLSNAGPWRVAIEMDDLLENSFAVLSHQCHPFWVTTTNFYP